MAGYRFSYLFELESEPPAYLWTGHGFLEVDIDAETRRYLGAAHILSIPDLKQLINGVAERIEFGLSGVSAETLRLAQEDRASIELADARIGRINFDKDWQQAGDVEWLWHGFSDIITTGSTPSDTGRTRTITLGLASADTRRSNPQIAFFTDADQRKRSAGDAFFSHVGQINMGVTRRFGPK